VPRKNASPGAPELRLIPGGAGPDDAPVLLPSVEDLDVAPLVGSIYQDLAGQVRKATSALEAELVVSAWLGVMTATISLGAPAHETDEATFAFLTRLVDHAHRQGTTEALATLRVLAVLAPGEVSAYAGHLAWRLADGGTRERTWAGSLGVPMIGRCWRYGDVAGQQVSVNLTFEYGSADHLLSVLIDNGLGGGIKDCWLGDAPALAWQRITELAGSDPEVVVDELPWPAARDLVLAALEEVPCPVEDDQVQDLAEFMPLLRARMSHLTRDGR
jgi:hypothetical protein